MKAISPLAQVLYIKFHLDGVEIYKNLVMLLLFLNWFLLHFFSSC